MLAISFVERLKSHFAGFTVTVRVNGHISLGTDFSNKPNYLTILNDGNFPFPNLAYKSFVLRFAIIDNKDLISLNRKFTTNGCQHTLSIFDTETKRFVHCNHVDYSEKGDLDVTLHYNLIKSRSNASLSTEFT